jgi:hypothetical protein
MNGHHLGYSDLLDADDLFEDAWDEEWYDDELDDEDLDEDDDIAELAEAMSGVFGSLTPAESFSSGTAWPISTASASGRLTWPVRRPWKPSSTSSASASFPSPDDRIRRNGRVVHRMRRAASCAAPALTVARRRHAISGDGNRRGGGAVVTKEG